MTTSGAWGVVVPVKPRARAKSRLAPLGDEVRRELTTAFALDTVTAALACPEVATVLVITDDLGIADLVRTAGATALPDGRPGDLNASLWQGAAELDRRRPGAPVAGVGGDPPRLPS
jgi:2-phospho-L-lactate/phosphoenolpyruvate guanylyltransferase